MAKEAPQRTCIGCRGTFDKTHMLRFVLAPDGSLVPDLMRKLPGRGAYVCMKALCIHNACEKKHFSRTFKREVLGDFPDILLDRISRTMEERIASYIALANKAGKVVSGSDMVSDTLKRCSSEKKLVLIATDVSEDIGQRIRFLSESHGVKHFSLFNKDYFGELLGKSQRSVIAIQGSGFVEALNMELERYRNFLRGEGCAE
jgi:uncharacterized protein